MSVFRVTSRIARYMGFSKNRGGPPKWMVYFIENPMNKWMIWGGFPLFLEPPYGSKNCGFGVIPKIHRNETQGTYRFHETILRFGER